MSVQSISDFVKQVTTQQGLNLSKAKYINLINFFPQLYNNTQAISSILNGGYTYLSCIYIGGIAYWEFINTGNFTNFSKFQFIYVVVNYPNFIKLKSLVPYYYEWDSNTKLVNLIYPTKNYVLDTDASSWGQYYLINIGAGFNHPFLPTFQFTGNICLLKKVLLYEYNDTKGWYGPKGVNYLSPIRPLNLNYPLGIPNNLQLIQDNCYSVNNIQYSSTGNSNYAGQYMGQYTNSSYNKHITFWLYKNSSSIFLLENPPAYNTQGLALSAIYNSGDKKSPTNFSSTFLYTFNITQSSSTSIIHIR